MGYYGNIERITMNNKYTGDLFGIELIKCPNCDGVGEIDETPKGAKGYEIFEECDICGGTGEVNND